MAEILKSRVIVHKHDVVDSIEIIDRGKLRYYSYTYLAYHPRNSSWRPVVRWDNYEQQPHVDKYDEAGSLLGQMACREKTLDEVVKLVQIFRRNLVAMEVADL